MRKVEHTEAFQRAYEELRNWMYGNDYNGDLEFAFRNGFNLWAIYLWQGSGASKLPGVRLPVKRLEAERKQLCKYADVFVCSHCNHHSFFAPKEIEETETQCESCLKMMRLDRRGEES